ARGLRSTYRRGDGSDEGAKIRGGEEGGGDTEGQEGRTGRRPDQARRRPGGEGGQGRRRLGGQGRQGGGQGRREAGGRSRDSGRSGCEDRALQRHAQEREEVTAGER